MATTRSPVAVKFAQVRGRWGEPGKLGVARFPGTIEGDGEQARGARVYDASRGPGRLGDVDQEGPQVSHLGTGETLGREAGGHAGCEGHCERILRCCRIYICRLLSPKLPLLRLC